MTTGVQSPAAGGAQPSSAGLADVIDTILDKGLVIDAYVRVQLLGIELLTVDARIAIASVDTYLRFAEAVNRLDLTESGGKGLPELVEGGTESVAKGKSKGAVEAVAERVLDALDRKSEREPERDKR